MNKLVKFLIAITFYGYIYAQEEPIFFEENVSFEDLGVVEVETNTYSLDADDYLYETHALPSGEPDLEYNYLWLFGDGQYSISQYPVHTYAEPGSYSVTLMATPRYSGTGPPPALMISESIIVDDEIEYSYPSILEPGEVIDLSSNRLPRINTESTYLITYKNTTSIDALVPVTFYYNNEYVEKVKFFSFEGELITSETEIGDPDYNQQITIENTLMLASGEERTIMVQLYTKTEAMAEPESPAIDLFFKAETDGGSVGEVYMDEMVVQAVGSWDPNNKVPSVRSLPLNLVGEPQIIDYRINFENIGTASTNKVVVVDYVDDLLDISSFNFIADKNNHPDLAIEINETSREITFTFNSFYLNGLGDSTSTPDECRYWVDFGFELDIAAYNEQFASHDCMQEKSIIGEFGQNATITFDENDPILTNKALTTVYCNSTNPASVYTESTNEDVYIFPNPGNGNITIESVLFDSSSLLKIYSLTGELILEQNFNENGRITTDFEGNSGFYLVEIYLANGQVIKRKILRY